MRQLQVRQRCSFRANICLIEGTLCQSHNRSHSSLAHPTAVLPVYLPTCRGRRPKSLPNNISSQHTRVKPCVAVRLGPSPTTFRRHFYLTQQTGCTRGFLCIRISNRGSAVPQVRPCMARPGEPPGPSDATCKRDGRLARPPVIVARQCTAAGRAARPYRCAPSFWSPARGSARARCPCQAGPRVATRSASAAGHRH